MTRQTLMPDESPRFYSTIFYNTAQAKKNNTGVLMYTFETWNEGPAGAGKDAAGTKIQVTARPTITSRSLYSWD